MTLLEAERRKTEFLQRWTEELPNLDVVWGRAEEQPLETYGVAVAKALAQPPVAAEWCLPLVEEGGAASSGSARRRTRMPSLASQSGSPASSRSRRRASSSSGRPGRLRPASRGGPGWRRSARSPSRRTAGSGVPEPHPAELERRGDDVVPERPEVRHDAQFDLGALVTGDEVAERLHLDRLDRRPRNPVAADLRVRLEGGLRQPVGEHRGRAHPFEPALLDRVHPRRAAEEPCCVGGVGRAVGPERPARALAREPVERADGACRSPTRAARLLGRLAHMRLEPLDRGVLADVPERVRTLVRVGRSRVTHRQRIVRGPL